MLMNAARGQQHLTVNCRGSVRLHDLLAQQHPPKLGEYGDGARMGDWDGLFVNNYG
jgi:hypothetical protein